MKKRQNRVLNVFLSFIVVFYMVCCPDKVYAGESVSDCVTDVNNLHGYLPVYCIENDGSSMHFLEVCSVNGRLYTESKSFADKFGYQTAETDNHTVQFLQCANKAGENYRWTMLSCFAIGKRTVWLSDGTDTVYYDAPFESFKDKDGIWIPLQFALKIMGREMCINNGIIIVSQPHESQDMLINDVHKYYSSYFNVIERSNDYLREEGFECSTDPLLSEAIRSENEKYEWLYSSVMNAPAVSGVSSDGIDELATYLVSNVSPENEAMYGAYYELLQMYMSPETMLGGVEMVGSLVYAGQDESYEVTSTQIKIVEDSANLISEMNPENIKYNDAFRTAYLGLTGYDPINMTWENETIYEELCKALFVYRGDPNMEITTSLAYIFQFIPIVGSMSNSIANIYVYFQCMNNVMAKDDYASTRFGNYVSYGCGLDGNNELLTAIRDRVDDYDSYQQRIMEEAMAEALDSDVKGGVDNYIRELIKAELPVFGFVFLLYDFDKYCADMKAAAEKDLEKKAGAYKWARYFAYSLMVDAYEQHNIDWAYCFYKTDCVAETYYLKALEKSGVGNEMPSDEYLSLCDLVRERVEEDTYHLAEIKVGICYGLNPENNEQYNNDYDDSKLLQYIEEIDFSVGNSNANMNAYGFVASTEEHIFLVDSNESYRAYMTNLKGTEKKQITNGSVMWLNAIDTDSGEFLYYINDSGDIYVYDVVENTNTELAEGAYSKLMVGYGYIFAIENGVLYRFDINKKEVGDRKELVSDIGSCVAYTDDCIYYTNTGNELFKSDLEGDKEESLGIRTASFDISNGNIYFSNEDDSRRIYIYNELSGFTSLLSDKENTYCLNFYNGMVYFKVDDDMDNGLLYSVVPLVNVVVTRVYSWEGQDDEIGVGLSSDIVNNFGRTDRRMFNILNGKIYNEAYLWIISEYPVAGINKNVIMGVLGYKISQAIHEM